MSEPEDELLPPIRRDPIVRTAVGGAYLLCAVVGAGTFGAGGTIEEEGWAQFADDLGAALVEWPLLHLGCLAAMTVGLCWPRTPIVLLGLSGAFLLPLGACLIRGIRIT